MLKTETVFGGFFLAAWAVSLAYVAGWLPPPGLPLSLYGLYSFAAAWGWVIGNLYVLRLRTLDPARRRRFLALYLVVPAGVVALTRGMMPVELRAAAPVAGALALAIHVVFFLVPYSLRPRT